MKLRGMGIVWLVCLVLFLSACTPKITQQDKSTWVYYVSYLDGNVHQCRPDGSEDTVSDVPQYMAKSGDWIYYSGGRDLYKKRTDGTGNALVVKGECYDLHVVGDTVVFLDTESDLSEGEGIMRMYRVGTDGTGRAEICKDHVQFHEFHVCGEWIIYRNLSDGRTLYRIRPDGSGRELIASPASQFTTAAGWIYWGYDDLYRMRPDGREKMSIVADSIKGLAIGGEWIYYINESDKDSIYKVKTDGTGRAKVTKGPAVDIATAGGWVYFGIWTKSLWGNDDVVTYRARMDGIGRTSTHTSNKYYDPFA